MTSPPPRRSRARELLVGLVLLAASLVVLSLLGEAGIRFLEPRSDRQRLYRTLGDSPRRWGYLANRDVLRDGVRVRTNSHGERGEEYPVEKSPGLVRIIGLGDSYTFGSGVPYDQTFLKVLETLLNQDPAGGAARYQAINLGVEGYNTEQELACYEEESPRLKPDLVLVGYLFNDVDDSVRPSGDVLPGRPMVTGRGLTHWITALKARSHFFSFLSPRVGALARRLGVKRVGLVGSYAGAFVAGNPGWERSSAALLKLNERASRDGARVVVLVLPAFVSLKPSTYPLHAYHRAVTGFCREHGIPALDLYPTFAGENAARYWISVSDPHPNGEANRRMGEAIHRFLLAQRLLPVPGSAGTPAPAATATAGR
jgi:lysophospholipase L1-like esterase